jgi:hypothetical protein
MIRRPTAWVPVPATTPDEVWLELKRAGRGRTVGRALRHAGDRGDGRFSETVPTVAGWAAFCCGARTVPVAFTTRKAARRYLRRFECVPGEGRIERLAPLTDSAPEAAAHGQE